MELIERHGTPRGRELLDHFPITVIQGARQVGKSTLAELLVADRPHRLVTLDDPVVLRSAQADPEAFVGQFPDGTLVIDELQLAGELTRVLKMNVDRDRRPGRFLLTGSADLLRVKADADSLAGRAVTLRLRGLSQGEIHRRPDDFISQLLAMEQPHGVTSTWRRPDYVDVIDIGGFPELQRPLASRLRTAWLDSYLDRVLERDAVMLPSGTATDRLRAIARLLAANQAGELVKARIADQAQIPQATITGYLDALRSVFLIDQLRPWTPNLTKREIGRPKTFISDSALALRLAGLTRDSLLPLTSSAIGGHLEAFVVAELLKQRGWSQTDYDLYHYRDRDGLEVDIVAELADGSIIGIEVKSSSSFKGEHFNGLRKLADRLGDRFRLGIVLSMAEEGLQFTRRCWGLPVAALWSA